MNKIVNQIGLIAGKSEFPIIFAKAAGAKGVKIIAVGIEGETKEELGDFVDKFYWVKLGELGKLLDIFKSEGISKAVMAGGVTKSRIFKEALKIDGIMSKILSSALDKRDETLLSMITLKLKSAGIELLNSSLFLEDLLPSEGQLTSIAPSQSQREDIKFGFPIAKEISGLDVGLSIAVKDKAVIAVEAIEGTDEMISRAGKLAGPGLTVIKVARPKQDMRFDLPVIGPETVHSMIEAKAGCIAVEAGKTLVLELPATVSLANNNNISIVSLKK